MTSSDPDPSAQDQAGGRPDEPSSADAFRGLADTAADMFDAYARMMAGLAGGRGTTGPVVRGARGQIGAPAALMDATAIASGSALRYGQRLTEVFARHQGALTSAATAHLSADGASPEQVRAEVEELRSFLREVGETARLEARRLDHELEELGESVAQAASEPDTKRRWTPKP
jgi:hypothetical protein